MIRKAGLVDGSMLKHFMNDCFEAVGVPKDDAEVCADVLITADQYGIDSHGIGRLKSIYIDRIRARQIRPTTEIEIVRESPTTAVIDGRNGLGQVIAKRSMQIALDKAKRLGMGMVAVRNSNHYGIAGYYVRMAASTNMIGITGTNARPSVAPTFGIEAMLGTNPLAFGLPTDEPFPFILDCATSASQRGKIEVYARQNRDLPLGWVIGSDGRPRTDTGLVLRDLVEKKAALLPLGGSGETTGGHKGYGYSTVVEILSAALQEGSFLNELSGRDAAGNPSPLHIGHFFMAVDISAFTDPEAFKKTAGDILRAIRNSRKAPGEKRIYTAGEKEYRVWADRRKEGIRLDASVQQDILDLKNDLHLSRHRFPFESVSEKNSPRSVR